MFHWGERVDVPIWRHWERWTNAIIVLGPEELCITAWSWRRRVDQIDEVKPPWRETMRSGCRQIAQESSVVSPVAYTVEYEEGNRRSWIYLVRKLDVHNRKTRYANYHYNELRSRVKGQKTRREEEEIMFYWIPNVRYLLDATVFQMRDRHRRL